MNSESQSLVPATQQAESEELTVDEVRESLSTTEKGQPANTIGNCRTVFCQDPLLRGAIRLNLLTDRVDIVRDLGWRRSTSALTDTDVKYLLLYFEQNYGLTSEKKLMAALSIVANENCYHPILDVLNSLVWDGEPRIRSCLNHFLGADESDYDDLGTNEIVINKYRTDRSELNYGDLQVGDSLTFRFEVGGQTIEETFTVAGIAYFPSTGLFYCTQEAIEQISPYNNTTHISIFCDKNYTESVKDRLASLISGNPNLRLKVYSEEYSMIAGFINVTMSSLYAISAFVVIFGLLNMINMLINSAIIRKREFALLQAVGMTNRQLRKMLYREGMSVSIKSALLAAAFGITIGGLLCYLANKVMALKFVIFAIDPLPVLLFAAVLIGLQILVSYCICRSIEKTSLIENLRAE